MVENYRVVLCKSVNEKYNPMPTCTSLSDVQYSTQKVRAFVTIPNTSYNWIEEIL
jgi:hypothetical protein